MPVPTFEGIIGSGTDSVDTTQAIIAATTDDAYHIVIFGYSLFDPANDLPEFDDPPFLIDTITVPPRWACKISSDSDDQFDWFGESEYSQVADDGSVEMFRWMWWGIVTAPVPIGTTFTPNFLTAPDSSEMRIALFSDVGVDGVIQDYEGATNPGAYQNFANVVLYRYQRDNGPDITYSEDWTESWYDTDMVTVIDSGFLVGCFYHPGWVRPGVGAAYVSDQDWQPRYDSRTGGVPDTNMTIMESWEVEYEATTSEGMLTHVHSLSFGYLLTTDENPQVDVEYAPSLSLGSYVDTTGLPPHYTHGEVWKNSGPSALHYGWNIYMLIDSPDVYPYCPMGSHLSARMRRGIPLASTGPDLTPDPGYHADGGSIRLGSGDAAGPGSAVGYDLTGRIRLDA